MLYGVVPAMMTDTTTPDDASLERGIVTGGENRICANFEKSNTVAEVEICTRDRTHALRA